MSRFYKFLSLFMHDRERMDKLLRLYIHHKNLFNKGRGELGFIMGLFNPGFIMIGWLFLRDIFPNLPHWVLFVILPVSMLFEIGVSWIVGHWWDINQVYDKEADWNNSRNPISKAVSKTLLKGDGITR